MAHGRTTTVIALRLNDEPEIRLLQERASRAGVSLGIQARRELLRRLGLKPR